VLSPLLSLSSWGRLLVALLVTLATGCAAPVGDPKALLCLVNFDAGRAAIVQDAAGEWSERTNGDVALRFESVDHESSCMLGSVPVRLESNLRGETGEPSIGVTDGWREYIAFDPDPEWLWVMPTTARHELGHFLTTDDDHGGHSPDRRDIMFGRWTTQQDGHLTERDVARFYN
jgi:hypothetical protein